MSTKTGVPWPGIRQPPSSSEQGAQAIRLRSDMRSPSAGRLVRLKAGARGLGSGRERLALLGVLVFACAVRAGLALALPNIFYPDEIFQTLEPAHRLLFGYGIVSWEWRLGARNWLLPGFLAGVMQLSAGLGPGSSGYLVGTTLALSLFGVLPAWAAWRIARRSTGAAPALLAAFACAIWCELVYFSPKALNEVVAGNLLAAAVAFAPQPGEPTPRRRMLLCGSVFGLAVALRPQLGPAVLIAVAIVYRREWRRIAAPLLFGAAAAFALGGLLDAFTWGTPFHSYVRNPIENLVAGRSLWFGTEPWYGYLKSFLQVWIFSFGAILGLFAWGARRHPLPALIAGMVLLVHSAIAHKEYRFVYPAIALILLVAALASAELLHELQRRRPAWRTQALALAALAWTLASLGAAARLSPEHVVAGHSVSHDALYWRRHEGSKRSFAALSQRDDVCGVALLGVGWAFSGGYTHLHRDVPLFVVRRPEGIAASMPHANYLVTHRLDAPRLEAYTRERCWGPICLYGRPGGCRRQPGYDLNASIAERGE